MTVTRYEVAQRYNVGTLQKTKCTDQQQKKIKSNSIKADSANKTSTVYKLPPVGVYVGQPLKLFSGSAVKPQEVPREKTGGKIAVIDNFWEKKDIDADDVVDNTTHGEVVSSLIGEKNTEKVDTNLTLEYVGDKLKSLRKRVENGEKIDAVNISIGTHHDYKDLSETFKMDLNPENIKEKAPELIEKIRPGVNFLEEKSAEVITEIRDLIDQHDKLDFDSPEAIRIRRTFKALDVVNGKLMSYADAVKIYDEVDKLAKLGVPVIISSGNLSSDDIKDKKRALNLLALNDRAIIIGATEKTKSDPNHIRDFSVNNSLVDANLQGVYQKNELSPEIQSKLSFTGKTKLPEDCKNPEIGKVLGTSFSAPKAAKYAGMMHNKGMTVDEMNTLFAKAEKIAQTKKINIENVLRQMISNYKTK